MGTEIEELDAVRVHERGVMINLSIVNRRQEGHGFEFIYESVNHQIKTIRFRKSPIGSRYRYLRINLSHACRPQPGCQIRFVNGFVTESAQ